MFDFIHALFEAPKRTVKTIISDLDRILKELDYHVNEKAERVHAIDREIETLEAEKAVAADEGLRAKRVAAKLNDLLR